MSRKGFTMIELVLAMGFLATLLITIALLVNMITGIYQKGLSLRAVNATGRQLVDEFSRAVGSSPLATGINPIDRGGDGRIDDDDIAASLRIYFTSNPKPTAMNPNPDQTHGAFCTGMYSYIWNTQPSYEAWLTGDDSNVLQLRWQPDPLVDAWETAVYKLARVPDSTRSVCSTIAGDPDVTPAIPGIDHGDTITVPGIPVSLISDDETNLILYDFTVFPATQHTITKQTFYSATFILGTMRGGISIMSAGNYCNANDGALLGASGLITDFNYCAVNKFNFAMRATGEGGDPYGR